MRIRKVISERLERRSRGVNVAGAVNAVVSAEVDEPGTSSTRVSSRQRIVQRGGETVVSESVTEPAADEPEGTPPDDNRRSK